MLKFSLKPLFSADIIKAFPLMTNFSYLQGLNNLSGIYQNHLKLPRQMCQNYHWKNYITSYIFKMCLMLKAQNIILCIMRNGTLISSYAQCKRVIRTQKRTVFFCFSFSVRTSVHQIKGQGGSHTLACFVTCMQ